MKNYVPFLKLKVNEVGALKALTPDIAEGLVPFFDLPKQKDGANSEAFKALVVKAARSVENNLKSFYTFFLDNFDVDDSITIAGENNYAFVIDQFLDLNFIPVIGLDRPPDRNKLVFDRKRAGKIASDSIALRLQPEDFANFLLVKDDIGALIDKGSQFFKYWILVLDNRVCTKVKVADRTTQIAQFVAESHKTFKFFSVIVTGSSIPASIKDIIKVESDTTHDRKELVIYSGAIKKLKGIPMVLGDYTVVSPLYSEFQIPPAVMLNVEAVEKPISHPEMAVKMARDFSRHLHFID